MQSAVFRSHVVCPSVRPSVTLVDYCDHKGWNSSKIISPSVSLVYGRCLQPNTGLLQGKHPEIFARIGVRCWKKWLSAYKSSNISETRQDRTDILTILGKIGPINNLNCYWDRIGSAIDWCQSQWPWMTLKGHYALCFKTRAYFRNSELTVKIWMKIGLYCQRQRCSPMTLVSDNLRFVPIFEGVHWRERASNDSGVIENVDFHGFRCYVFSTLRNETNVINTIIFNLVSPFHWPRNIRPWLNLKSEWSWMIEVREVEFRIVIRRIFGIGGDSSSKRINNRQNLCSRLLVLHCISTDSKHFNRHLR